MLYPKIDTISLGFKHNNINSNSLTFNISFRLNSSNSGIIEQMTVATALSLIPSCVLYRRTRVRPFIGQDCGRYAPPRAAPINRERANRCLDTFELCLSRDVLGCSPRFAPARMRKCFDQSERVVKVTAEVRIQYYPHFVF